MRDETPANRRRVTRTRRFLVMMSILWIVLVPVAQLLHPAYLDSRWRNATWPLSLALFGLAWVATTVWSGVVPLKYGKRLYRSESPIAFWSQIALMMGLAIALFGYGIYRLQHDT